MRMYRIEGFLNGEPEWAEWDDDREEDLKPLQGSDALMREVLFRTESLDITPTGPFIPDPSPRLPGQAALMVLQHLDPRPAPVIIGAVPPCEGLDGMDELPEGAIP